MSGIARVQPEATLHPSKLELLAQWLPDQWWFDGDPSDLEIVAKFRFVDPDDVVGLDCMLVRSTDAIYHIPVTWRPHPLDGGALIGTLQHSELGTRYCYDAQTDPVYLDELVRVIREKDSDADIVHKLNRAPINDVVGQLMGQWRHRGIDRVDLLAVLH